VFENPDFEEAFQSFNVRLNVTSVEPDPVHPGHPKLHFRGEMFHGMSSMTGYVELTAEQFVRWHFVSGLALLISDRDTNLANDFRCRGKADRQCGGETLIISVENKT
jgi:hypothetical protein